MTYSTLPIYHIIYLCLTYIPPLIYSLYYYVNCVNVFDLSQETYLYLFKAIASICDETADRDSGIGNCKNYPSLITTTKPTNGTLNNGTIKPDAASV